MRQFSESVAAQFQAMGTPAEFSGYSAKEIEEALERLRYAVRVWQAARGIADKEDAMDDIVELTKDAVRMGATPLQIKNAKHF